MKWIRSLVSFPLKVSIWTVLLLLLWVVTIGDFGPRLRSAAAQGWALVRGQEATAFEAAVTKSPVRELEVIESTQARLQPQLAQAQALLRKQEAEVAYLRELCRFVEGRFALQPGENGDAAAVLGALARSARENTWRSPEERARFEHGGGPGWAAYQARIEASERSIEQVLQLYARVQTLNERLDTRRRSTLQLTSTATPGAAGPTPDCPVALAESHKLLENLHRELFTTLYALDAKLVDTEVEAESTLARGAAPSHR